MTPESPSPDRVNPAAGGSPVAPPGPRPPGPGAPPEGAAPPPAAPPPTPQRPGAALARFIRERWARCRRELGRCGARCAPAAVHDTRVAIRRLLALLDVIGILPDAPRVEKTRRRLRRALRRFGPLRDAQVLLDQVETLLPGSPDLARFRRDLRRRASRGRADARRALRAKRIGRLSRRFARLEARLRDADGDAIARTLTRAADAARARVAARRRALDADRPETLHRLRVAFKRFRYLLEVAGAVTGRDAPSRNRAMDDVQTVLGNIQDLAVAEAQLAAWGRKHSADLRAALDSLRRRRGQIAADFVRRADEVLAFWPPKNP